MKRYWLIGGLLFLSMNPISLYAQAQPAQSWYAGKLHPCTGDSVLVTAVTSFSANREVTTITVLGQSKEWPNVFNWSMIPQSELSEFIHGVIETAGLACGSGGSVSLPATAATSTFQQTIFTNIAKPRMASAGAASVQPQQQTLSKSTAPATTPAPLSTDEKVTLPVPGTNAESSQQPVATTPTETSTESGKAVELKVAKKESGTRPVLPPNNITTDLEWNAFSMKKQNGNNFALRASYNRTLSNEKVTLGATLVINTMLMLDKIFYNNALNLSGAYMLTETSSLERKVGGSVNAFIVDKAFYGTPFGMSVVASFSDNWFVNQDNIVTYGAMFQQSFVGETKTSLVTGGVLFGLPIGNRYAINPSCVMAYNVHTAGKNGSVTVDGPFMLQPAFNGSIYFTKLFSLDLGAKTTLFIKDYSDLIVTIGSTILF